MQDDRPKGWHGRPVVGCLALLIGVACGVPNAEGPPPEAGASADASEDAALGSGSGRSKPRDALAAESLPNSGGVSNLEIKSGATGSSAANVRPAANAGGSSGSKTASGLGAADGTAADAPTRRLAPPTPPEDIARAKRLLAKGTALYRRGEYEPAEEALKEAMTLYPFLADANLLLGKIFLIRGAASLDRTLIDHARLMFEMARKLDPTLSETDLLLELFAPPAAR